MATLEQALSGKSGAVVAERVKTFLSLHSSHQPLPPLSRKMCNTLTSAISSEMKCRHFPSLSDLLAFLSLVIRPPSAPLSPTSNLLSLLSFGLGRKIVEWLACLRSMPCTGSMDWRQACVSMATTTEEALDACREDKGRLLLLTTPLLEWVCQLELPVEARLPSARGVANLLEMMKGDQKTRLFHKHSHLFDQLVDGLTSAGDYDLQATMVECCISALGDRSGRRNHAHHWFSDHTLITAFMNIHENTFETDCRQFLTILNRAAGPERSVHSFLCKKVFLGKTELRPPREVGQEGFWLDVNSASLCLSLNVEDPCPSEGSGGLWETVTVSDQLMESWRIGTEKGDVVLSLTLTTPSHSLLSSLPPSPQHSLTISFPPSHNPALPLEAIFPTKNTTHIPREQGLTLSPSLSVKSSVAITPLFIRPTFEPNRVTLGKRPPSASSISHVSPIEVPPNIPTQGGQVCSQGSATPTNKPIPCPTPQTSTPKLRSSRSRFQTTPASGGGVVRPALQFSSGGATKKPSHVTSDPSGEGGRRATAAETGPLETKPDQSGRQPGPKDQGKRPSKQTKTDKLPTTAPQSKNLSNMAKSDRNGKQLTTQDQTKTKTRKMNPPSEQVPVEPQALAAGLTDVTNCLGGKRERETLRERVVDGEEGERGPPARPRVNRATGQRVFVLSHAPLTSVGGASRGRGSKTKGLGGREGRGKKARDDLLKAFDFRDSPSVVGVASPSIPTPHSIPSSLPSLPSSPPSSPPSHSHTKPQRNHSRSILHSTPDSDHDSDGTWNGDVPGPRGRGGGNVSGSVVEKVGVRRKGRGEKGKERATNSSNGEEKMKKQGQRKVGEKQRKREVGGKMLATKRACSRKISPSDSISREEERESVERKRGRGRPRKESSTTAQKIQSRSEGVLEATTGKRRKERKRKSSDDGLETGERVPQEIVDDPADGGKPLCGGGCGLQGQTVPTLTSRPARADGREGAGGGGEREDGETDKFLIPPPAKRPRTSSTHISFSASPPVLAASSAHNLQRSEVIQDATPPAPPSPCSVTSSNVGPDTNIISGFEKICQNLVARAWNQSPPPPLPSAADQKRKVAEREGKRKSEGRKRRSTSETTGQRKTLGSERREGRKSRQVTSVTSVTPVTPVMENAPDISIHSGSGELPPITELLRKRQKSEWKGKEQDGAVSMAKQPSVAKATSKKPRKGGVGGLEGVWLDTGKERSLIQTHNERVMGVLVAIETTLNRKWDRTERFLASSGETLSIISSDITAMERKMEKIRSLLSMFQTSLSDVEQRQSQAGGVARQGLRREMLALHQKAIKKANESQLAEMRQSLMALLIKL